tara:strand:- start:10919 stop:12763 length:1845 start_codon:yes stop_codon:yes gene_type:complete
LAKRIKPEEIINKVETHYDSTEPLRSRMEEDYSLYRLDPYDAGDGFHSYTSNEPSTYADKIVSFIASSEMIVRIPNISEDREQRTNNNIKERFFLGALRHANERLIKQLKPSIKAQLSWFISLRGWYAGRALIMKKDDKSYIDITPWDPMHTYWGTGDDGLTWACYKVKKSKEVIESEYNVKLTKNDNYEDWLDVYDYYDKDINMVVLSNGRVVKKATPHGSPRVPVFLGPVGATPMIQALNDHVPIDDTIADYGESVFKHNRDSYENHNFMMSVMLELTARSRKQGLKITSRDGMKTLDEDPYKEGTEISLAQGENIEPLGLLEAARETGAYMGLVSGEMQRGSIPHSLYGDIQFQLSGFAINTLRQGIDSVLQPKIDALEAAYTEMCMLVTDQYLTESFDVMELSGRDMNRTYFKEEITPSSMKDAGDMEITFVGQLPQDDMSKMSMAQIAREGQTPLLPDIFIRDKILGLQDTDNMEDSIKEQQAERSLPEAALWTLLSAAEERGRPDLAQFYYGELMHLMNQRTLERQQAEMALQQAEQAQQQATLGGGGEGIGTTGVPPQVRPNAMTGAPPPTPNPQAAAFVPPGTPRPGAQTEEERLTREGLGPEGEI